MALERSLLEHAKATSKEILESWCKYILRNSRSASLTAVVKSVVLAQPAKLFNVAKILFRTKELFLYDSSRLVLDQSLNSPTLDDEKSPFRAWETTKGNPDEDERIKACDSEHRKLSLEHLAFQYQFVKSENNPDFEKQGRRSGESGTNITKNCPRSRSNQKEIRLGACSWPEWTAEK